MQPEQQTLTLEAIVRDPSGGSYAIEGLFGKGVSGAVYLVRDQRVKQHLFALKEVIDPDKRVRERFIFEGELLKRLDHPALPRVYRVFEHDQLKRVYMLMHYIQGENLEALRKEYPGQRFTLPAVLALMAPIVDALIYLHRQDPPIVHRDIKPVNIIVQLGADRAMLVDFGSAKEYVADATTTVIRHGTPGYAALEQYGRGTTPRTDIYGLGASFYTLLTGRIPPDAITRASASRDCDPLEPAHLITPTIPTPVAQAIQRALSIRSEERFETVEAFWQELTVLPTRPVQLPRVTSVDTPQPLRRPGQDIEHKTDAFVQSQADAPRSSKRGARFPVLLALLLAVVIGVVFLSFTVGSGPFLSTRQGRVTAPVVSASATRTPGPSLYPRLAASYVGTIVDLLSKEKTGLSLSNMQQSQGSMRGFFQGLGLAGPFTGTLTPAGQVQFTLPVYGGNTTLVFAGTIKIGGDIVGTFQVLDHGHFTGESGLWTVAPSP